METNKLQYHDIILTDITLHAQTFRKPLPWYRMILRSLRAGKPGRVYFNSGISQEKNGKARIKIPLPDALKDEIIRAEQAGKKIRIFVPKSGLPLLAGKDTVEFMNAHPELLKKVK